MSNGLKKRLLCDSRWKSSEEPVIEINNLRCHRYSNCNTAQQQQLAFN